MIEANALLPNFNILRTNCVSELHSELVPCAWQPQCSNITIVSNSNEKTNWLSYWPEL